MPKREEPDDTVYNNSKKQKLHLPQPKVSPLQHNHNKEKQNLHLPPAKVSPLKHNHDKDHASDTPLPTDYSFRFTEENVTKDTIFGFTSCRNLSNLEIVKTNHGFVNFARSRTDPSGRLLLFLTWLDSTEGLQIQSQVVFPFGYYDTKSFAEVHSIDPDYHLRYIAACEAKNKPVPAIIKAYSDWVKTKKQEHQQK